MHFNDKHLTQYKQKLLPRLVFYVCHSKASQRGVSYMDLANTNQNILLLLDEIQSRLFCRDDLQAELAIN